MPNIAHGRRRSIDNALNAAGTNAGDVGLTKRGTGVVYEGMAMLGGGAVLAGLVLGAIAVFVIDRQYVRA